VTGGNWTVDMQPSSRGKTHVAFTPPVVSRTINPDFPFSFRALGRKCHPPLTAHLWSSLLPLGFLFHPGTKQRTWPSFLKPNVFLFFPRPFGARRIIAVLKDPPTKVFSQVSIQVAVLIRERSPSSSLTLFRTLLRLLRRLGPSLSPLCRSLFDCPRRTNTHTPHPTQPPNILYGKTPPPHPPQKSSISVVEKRRNSVV